MGSGRATRAGARRVGLKGLLLGTVVLALSPAPPARAAVPRPSPPVSFSFGAAGDHSSGPRTTAVLRRIGSGNLAFFLSLGDLSYDTMGPQAWCQYVKDNLNAGTGRPRGAPYGQRFPFLLTEGNHDTASFGAFLAPSCLPPRLVAVPLPAGGYGREYYVDYPTAAPLARVIVTAPGIRSSYAPGSRRYRWLSDTIDGARRAGRRWVIVAEHKNYVSTGAKSDEVSAGFFNLLVRKRVDLVLQGHDHTYQRSAQLALGARCPAVPTRRVGPGCIVNPGRSGYYQGGAGTVLVINGSGGQRNYKVSPSDSDAGYFARIMGRNVADASGYTRITVTPTAIRAFYVRAAGGYFADSFAVVRPGGDRIPPTPPTGLRAHAANSTTVDLAWNRSFDNGGAVAYLVFRNGLLISRTGRTDFRNVGLRPATARRYVVRAYDARGNVSGPSNPVVIGTPAR